MECYQFPRFHPKPFMRHRVVITVVRGSRHAPVFNPHIDLVALRDYDSAIQIIQSSAFAAVFSLLMLLSIRSEKRL
jgi:hypothetical protein